MNTKKKIISAAVSGVIAFMSLNMGFADAAKLEIPEASYDNIPYITEDVSFGMKSSSNPDLKAIVSSLGGDTDAFNFTNYRPTDIGQDMIDWLDSIGETDAASTLPYLNGGLCNGFASLQVLVHNGIISPSDIQEGAETLNDIVLDDNVNDILCAYAMMQSFSIQEMVYHEYYCSHDTEEQCMDLISYGEKAMESGKYFFIAIGTPKFSHAVVGIGIADGSWNYNGKKYDKCLLTLDSNSADPDDITKYGGFKDKGAIYINSATNEFYFPAYDYGSDNGGFISLVTDDTDMLNYKGLFNPSKSVNPDYYNIKSIEIHSYTENEYNVYVNKDGKTEKYRGYMEKPIEGITKNSWKMMGNHTYRYFREADSISIEVIPTEEDYSDIPYRPLAGDPVSIDMESQNYYNYVSGSRLFKGTIEENKVTFENKTKGIDGRDDFVIQMIKDKYIHPYTYLMLNGITTETVSCEATEKGYLISGTNGVQCVCDLASNPESMKTFKITASGNVMLKYDESTDSFYFTIGSNYDTVVETGDVDCDGTINAIDASAVLNGYAAAQTGGTNYINETLGDFNGDGTINAIDASMILAYYAEMQTQ